ncbi:MAG: DUF202 domain-containing protein [Candidatus Eremiobacteraeota bacterium]|nr:DUF202 domain-containing protein [Candidatus Eremiobacteraeota bacterium]
MDEKQTEDGKILKTISSNDLATQRTDLASSRTDLASSRTDLASSRTDLAVKRTRMAAERTLMAWMRTSLSFISFGFTLYKFFQYLRDSKLIFPGIRVSAPKNLGLALVIFGVVILVVSALEHILFIRELNKETNSHFKLSSALVFAVLFLLIGLFALINILFKVGPF